MPLVYAHRGLAVNAPENSLAAFRAAAELGVVWIETDVNVSAEGTAFLLHDPSLDRMTGAPGVISQMSDRQIRARRLPGDEPIPTLTEALEALPDACFNIDLKDEASAAAVPQVLHAAGAVGRVRVASFSDARRRRALAALRELGYLMAPGLGSADRGNMGRGRASRGVGDSTDLSPREAVLSSPGRLGIALFLVAAAIFGSRVGPVWALASRMIRRWVPPFDALQVPESHRVGPVRVPVVTRRFIAAAHACGLRVEVWTVNDPAEMRRLQALGVDGLITDRADLALSSL